MRFVHQQLNEIQLRGWWADALVKAMREAGVVAGTSASEADYAAYRARLVSEPDFLESQRRIVFSGVAPRGGSGVFCNGFNDLQCVPDAGYVHRVAGEIISKFDRQGRLTHKYLPSGLVTLDYENGRLTRILLNDHIAMHFEYEGPLGLISRIVGSDGHHISLDYVKRRQRFLPSVVRCGSAEYSFEYGGADNMTHFTLYSYNFCCPVRTLRTRAGDGRWTPRTPAMSAGLAGHVWPLAEWLGHPVPFN
jgi:hypothetical protein